MSITPGEMTWLTIVIPTYNRRNTICRAIDSCLQDSTLEYEILVVDDASTDDTVDILHRYGTDRLRTVRLERNVGVSAARTAGVEAANGKWVLFLDSDDELMPGALLTLRERCEDVAPDIARLASMCIHDDGHFSPQPWRPGVIMDYRTYLEWSERVTQSDFSNCIRRSSFSVVPFPCGRSYESIYHLDFAKAFKTLCCGDVIARVHADAPDRLTRTGTGCLRDRLLAEAESRMRAMGDIIDRHGEALRRYAPSRAWVFSRAFITAALIAGHRRVALRGFLDHVGRHPWSYSVWSIMVLGLLSRRALAWVIAMKKGT